MDRLDRLNKVIKHLNIALGEFSHIAGSTYVGSLREYHKLVRTKLSLEDIVKKLTRGYNWESNRKRTSKTLSGD